MSARACSSWVGESASRVDRAFEQRDPLVAARGAGAGAQACAERAGEAEALSERDVLVGVPTGVADLAEGDERLGGVDAPRGEARVQDAELLPPCSGAAEIGVGVGRPVLREPQPRAALQQQR